MIQGFKAQDTGRVIAFAPRERTASRRVRPEGERGQVVILPVIRIERYGQDQAHAPEQPLASPANSGPARRRRRRTLRS